MEKSKKKLKDVVFAHFGESCKEDIDRALAFAEQAHSGQTRSSGEPYLIHPIQVALTIAGMRLDIASVITGLLHDTVEDTSVTLSEIRQEFGDEIAVLVDGVTKLSRVTFSSQEERQAENFRKMFLAMAQDIRVILIKLADRYHNMMTLQHLRPEKQQSVALETLEIYAPLANRLGLGWLKVELEDLCLRYLHPEVYDRLKGDIAQKKRERDRYIEEFSQELKNQLQDYDIRGDVSGRAKHFFSIYKKMMRRNMDFDQITDIIAFRIIVDNITECYKTLGVIHAQYIPIPGRFKDYIAIPKANNYRSLHTTVIGPKGKRIEIQIRTQEMHEIAEKGIAAHWKYKEGKMDARSSKQVDWVARLVEWQKELSDPNEFLDTVKVDLFAEDVFVFTPNGEVRQLPHGSGPLDFAYSIHTDVGHRCVGAKVNGKMVPLRHRLKSGDTVEVLTSPHQTPNKDWLNFIRSSRAKAKIRAFIKHKESEKAIELGRGLLDKELKAHGSNLSRLEKTDYLSGIVERSKLQNPEHLFSFLGYGKMEVEKVVSFLVEQNFLKLNKKESESEQDQTSSFEKEKPGFLGKIKAASQRLLSPTDSIVVSGLDHILVRFARCCNPLPGDAIVGFISRGKGVTIHRARCSRALDLSAERRIDVRWSGADKNHQKHQSKIRVVCADEPGILAKLSVTIGNQGVNISSAHIQTTSDKKAICHFGVQVQDLEQLNKVLGRLEGTRGVISVDRVHSA